MEVFEFLLAFIQKIKIMLTKNISKWYISYDQHTILIMFLYGHVYLLLKCKYKIQVWTK